jgi:regulatory protein
MKVTEVSPQKKNPKRFNVFLDGQFAFGADEDLIVNHRLLPGKEINPEDVEKLLYEAEVGKLMEKVYGQLNVRLRSEREVRDFLKRLSFKRKVKDEDEISELIVETLIERLKNKGLINDEEFARTWVDARRRSKKLGLRALKFELSGKGIDRKVVEKILDPGQARMITEEQLAEQALEKKLRIWKNLPDQEFKKKATDFLLRKGFDYSLVKEVVDKNLKKTYN